MAGLTQLFPEFVAHLALLIVLCYINGLLFRKLRHQPEERLPAINGILFGLTAIAGMMMPMTLAEGGSFSTPATSSSCWPHPMAASPPASSRA